MWWQHAGYEKKAKTLLIKIICQLMCKNVFNYFYEFFNPADSNRAKNGQFEHT